MAGMVPGDVREIVVTIPDSWETERLRGVPARCTVKVNEVFQWELPEVRGPAEGSVLRSRVNIDGQPGLVFGAARCSKLAGSRVEGFDSVRLLKRLQWGGDRAPRHVAVFKTGFE